MTSHQKVSVVLTVRNEAQNIESLFVSIAQQTYLPNEIVVVDGGSGDGTVSLLHKFAKKWPELCIRIIEKPTSIPEGRNLGIQSAKNDWLAITDAGCVLHPSWLAELLKKQTETGAQIVAGFAIGDPQSAFEIAVVPYVLVMPDRVDPENYLPATRSMLLHRSVWEQLGGFPERLQVSEDYAFARAARAAGVAMSFAPDAVVRWRPRSTVAAFFRMVYLQARDDVRAGIVRPKVVLVWARYAFGVFGLLLVAFVHSWVFAEMLMLLAGMLYVGWAVGKNVRYVGRAWGWLPLLQVVADFGVMVGSVKGIVSFKKQ